MQGRLNGARMRGTLMPVGSGGHRLYINGGMRAAAGVDVGDTIRLELQAMVAGNSKLPADLTRALRAASSALTSFRDMTLACQRELLRFIDDARTASTRARRIQQTVSHVMPPASVTPVRVHKTHRGQIERELWTCPRCGNQFINRNQYHACRRYDRISNQEWRPAEGIYMGATLGSRAALVSTGILAAGALAYVLIIGAILTT
ncbi:MAG: YdeI/OmpD-associated family protein [Longimicrobiales bacterium]